MSCRVLARQAEPNTQKLPAQEAKKLGVRRSIGEYISTKNNGMVCRHN